MPTSVSGKRITLEVCVTTADEAVAAVAAGADRVELCSALEVGGLTPSPAAFLDVRAELSVQVCVLIRPRPGGFVYSPGEWATVLRDVEWFLTNGADAIVCGALDESGRLERCRELVRATARRAVLNRAIDFLPDLTDALSEAIDLGFSRVLTSGGHSTALAGQEVLRELVRWANGRIEVLPAGGIKPGNVAELVQATSCEQVHGSLRTPAVVPGGNVFVAAGMGAATRTNPDEVAAVRAELDRLAAG